MNPDLRPDDHDLDLDLERAADLALEGRPDGDDDAMERLAAALALGLARRDGIEPPPRALADRLRDDALGVLAPATPAFPRRLGRLAALSGWVAAGAAAAALAVAWMRGPEVVRVTVPYEVRVEVPAPPPPEPPSPAERLAALLASTTPVPLLSTGHPLAGDARGEVAWDSGRQEGYLRLVGLPPVDPRRGVYQLWIFDKGRDDRYPVDGGVFTVSDTADPAVIPIRAALPVSEPTLFAVTLEPPGGVVVSDRKRLLLTAGWGP